jgi:hypothetical protein
MRANADVLENLIYRRVEMANDNPHPTFGTPPPAARRGGVGLGLGTVILGVLGAFVLVMFVGFKIIDCRRTNEYGGGGVACDKAGPRLREEWINAPNKLRDDMASPAKLGFSAEGQCLEKIRERQLSCEDNSVIGNDSPYLREALERGFTMYVCETVGGRDVAPPREYPLHRVIGR